MPVFAAKQDHVPDWVKSAAEVKLPEYPAETDAVVLLDDTTYSVAEDGTATEHYRQVLKILRPQGRRNAIVTVPYDNDSKLLSLHVWSIGADGHEYALNDKEIVEHGFPGQGNLYEDVRYKQATPPGADPGGIVAYEYEQRMRPYVREKTWWVQGDLPELNQSFTLQLPTGFNYETVWAHHEPIKAADLEHQRWHWEVKDAPAVDLRHLKYRPSTLALAGRMTIHYGPAGTAATKDSWSSIGEWYAGLSHDRLAATPEIAAKAKELTEGKTDFFDRTQVLGEFVQRQIRYFVIEIGIGGYQPHFAADIFRNRYGDCKDKATLLSSMLSTVGIHAALLMVDHRHGVIDPAAPSIVGDHMVTAIEVPAGYESPRLHSVITAKTGKRYLVFDPTWDQTAIGQVEHELQGSYGVLMEGSDTEAVRIPVMSPELNTIRRNGRFEVHPNGSITGTVVEKRFGDSSVELRQLYTGADVKQQNEHLEHFLGEDFVSFKTADFKVADAETLTKEMTTSYALESETFGKTMGPLLMIRPRVLGSYGIELDHKKRTVPIDLREAEQATDEYEITFPAGYAIDEVPAPVKLDVGFASYVSKTEVKGNVLRYTRTFTVSQPVIPAEKYSDLQKLAETVGADEQSRAVLKRQ